MSDDAKSFWTSLPGVLTGVAAVVTSLTGLFVAINGGLPKPSQDEVTVATLAPAPATNPAAMVPPAEIYALAATIEDADGFTNVRKGRGPKTELLAVVKNGERFHTYRQDTKWWKVKTRDGVIGYIHQSRIRLVDAAPGG